MQNKQTKHSVVTSSAAIEWLYKMRQTKQIVVTSSAAL